MLKVFLVSIFLVSHSAQAASDLCEFYRRVFPAFAKAFCSGSSTTRPAGANSTFSGSFNVNPATTPSEPSPYGLETIASFIRKPETEWAAQFSLIKGFKKFGTGVSTSGSTTFYSNDVLQRTEGTPNVTTFETVDDPEGELPNLNLGTAFALNPTQKGNLTALKLGLTARYNRMTDTFGGGLGVSGGNSKLTYGLGLTRENVSRRFVSVYFGTFFISVRLFFLEIEYTLLKNYRGPLLPPIQIATATVNMGTLMLTAAMRRIYYTLEGVQKQPHYGVQWKFSNHLTAGYLYNYIPGTHSIGTQIFF